MLIIAMFLLVLSGCGYKANPYYEEDMSIEDKNVKFIIKNNEINESVDR
ncbi:MAG: hypothetical protein U9P72_03150 [Campylobacterota bacterium]|nr:hypothetical protein [Campylobacterota bacterium]